jgi:RHS repeat-associated protein
VYGKIHRIVKATGDRIDYGYDAVGNRIYKQVKYQDTTVKTWYIRDGQGNVLAVYGNRSWEGNTIKWKEQQLYGSSRLGMWRPDTTVPSTPAAMNNNSKVQDSTMYGTRRYELSNHLGSVLAVITDKKVGVDTGGDQVVDYYVAEVSSTQDYYPFGMGMPGRTGREVTTRFVTSDSTGAGQPTPQDLTVTQRSGNVPTEYRATNSVTLDANFESGVNDAFLAYINPNPPPPQDIAAGSYYSGGEGGYRYGFQKSEQDDEVKGIGNELDYGMRIYDPRVGRFLSVDPLMRKYPYYTPYQFAGNSPIKFIDLDGLEPANNPKTPGAAEEGAINVITGIETMAGRNNVETNLLSSGLYRSSDEDLKGAYSCKICTGYVTDTKKASADRFNMYVSNSAVLNVDESQAAHFNNYESFVVSRLISNFASGEGAENYNFPTNGIISSKFLQSDVLKSALNDFSKGNKVEATQYSFGGKELGKDLLRTGTLFSITGFVGSGTITIVPTKDAILIKIFNVTSLTSGDLFKNPSSDSGWPRSYVRDPRQTTPYGNISQTFNLSIPWSSPLLSGSK